jgi:cytochrome P450
MATQVIPSSDVDLFSDEVMEDPFPAYRELRDAGPIVYLEALDAYALMRYDDVRAAVKNWKEFTSIHGTSFNEKMNAHIVGAATVLTLEPPDHGRLQSAILERFKPSSVRELSEQVYGVAAELATNLVERGEFDAVTDLAQPLVTEVGGDLIGLSPELKEEFRIGSTAMFVSMGPDNKHTAAALPVFESMIGTLVQIKTEDLREGSYGRALYEAADRGDVPEGSAGMLIFNYSGPAFDTTINAISSLVWLLAENPDQWDLVRADPSLIQPAREEGLRVESAIQNWGRFCRDDVEVAGTSLKAGDQVLVGLGSANRDERHYPDADRFDVRRKARDHVGFGVGMHTCLGASLARLEIEAFLKAFADQDVRFEVTGTPKRLMGNTVRGFENLPVTVTRAG